MPFTARVKSSNGHASALPVEFVYLTECAPVLGRAKVLGNRGVAGVPGKLGKAAAFGKTLLPGSEGVFYDKILVRRACDGAAFSGTEPRIEAQKPFSSRGGMTGGCQGEQRGCGNEGLHREIILSGKT
jgi:hypothetical protein